MDGATGNRVLLTLDCEQVSPMPRGIVFRVTTPLGYYVVLTRNRWREILRFKHPAVAVYEKEARKCLRSPDLIRASTKDANVHLYYLKLDTRYLCVVVAGIASKVESGFVVTAYLTKRPKQGDELWTK